MLNVCALMGRLTADPELRKTSTDRSVTSFSIAVDRAFVRQGEERQADFINIVCWGQTAEFVCRYFKKGDMIALNGRIQTRRYEDNQGNKRTAFEVIADNVSFTGSKRDSSAQSDGGYPAETRPAAQSAAFSTGNDDFDLLGNDDMPF